MENIKIISGNEKISEVVKIFAEYKSELNLDLSFQPADDSAENILKKYEEPAEKIVGEGD